MNEVQKSKVAFFELFTVFILYGFFTWILVPNIFISQATFYVTCILLACAFLYFFYISPILIHKDKLESRGLLKRNFLQVWKIIAITFLITSVFIIVMAYYKSSSFFLDPDWYSLILKFSFYLFSAFFQDLFFFSFLLLRIKELILINEGKQKQIIVSFIFALFYTLSHLPNLAVMGLSFLFAAYLGYIFYKTPNLYVIVIVHAFLGTLLHRVYELHMKIGTFYGMPTGEGHLIRFFVPFIHNIIGGRW